MDVEKNTYLDSSPSAQEHNISPSPPTPLIISLSSATVESKKSPLRIKHAKLYAMRSLIVFRICNVNKIYCTFVISSEFRS